MRSILVLIIVSVCLALYLQLAKRLNLLDIPNERSSHSKPTYRGAGIVFFIAYVAGLFVFKEQSLWLSSGLLLATVVGFIDDYKGMGAGMRALLYLTALTLCLFSIQGFEVLDWYYVLLTVVLGLGTVNAYNFMDGINGITVLYSVVLVASLWFLAEYYELLFPLSILQVTLISCLVFAFLNFRRKALAFMGDVGSVFLGMLAVYLVVLFIWRAEEPAWVLLLLLYGVDSVLTIVERLIRKENIFRAHRRHLYQLLANEYGWSHLLVATLYGVVQLLLNALLFNLVDRDMPTATIIVVMISGTGALYLTLKIFALNKLNKRLESK